MTAIRMAVRRTATQTLCLQADLTVNFAANTPTPYQTIVDTSSALGSLSYDILRIMRVQLPSASAAGGFVVLLPENRREIADRYARWVIPTGFPRMFMDNYGQIGLVPIPTVPITGATVHVAYAPTGEGYETLTGWEREWEDVLVYGALSELLAQPSRNRDTVLAKDYRRKFEIEVANIRSAVEFGTSGRYVIKSEPYRNLWPSIIGPGGGY